MEEESFLHSVPLRDSMTGGENARRTGRPGGRALARPTLDYVPHLSWAKITAEAQF